MADLIVVLDGARLVEVGTHEELVARSGQYAELYGIQAAAYRLLRPKARAASYVMIALDDDPAHQSDDG